MDLNKRSGPNQEQTRTRTNRGKKEDYFKIRGVFTLLWTFCFVCFDLGFQISNPVIKYWLDPSCMSYMEARVEMPRENNSQVPIPKAQRVADHMHLLLAFLPVWDSNLQRAD